MKINKALKTKWIKALRSGKYKQGRGRLRTEDNKYCCLGVLCDLVDTKRSKWKKEQYDDEATVSWGFADADTVPPPSVTKKLGCVLSKDENEEFFDPVIAAGDLYEKLADRNDSGKWSFKKIAAWIEKNL